MKARIKTTGEIVEVVITQRETHTGEQVYMTDDSRLIEESGLDFNVDDTPDYWTRLKHQYAGMVMQGLIIDANNRLCEKLNNNEDVQNANEIVKEHKRIAASICVSYATALIEKLREEK